VEQVKAPGNVKGAWMTSGTPSDCVKLAVLEILPSPPDIVISGINHGANLGGDILASGTVAAAMEGAFLEIPSIAVSLDADQQMEMHYASAAEVVNRLVKILTKAHFSERSLLNVNVPNVPHAQLRGAAVTELGVRLHQDRFEKRTDPRGRSYYWLAGETLETKAAENSDIWAISEKFVSITPISFNMTDRKAMDRLAQLLEVDHMGRGHAEHSSAGQSSGHKGRDKDLAKEHNQ
jgi:5'-nucleotidase